MKTHHISLGDMLLLALMIFWMVMATIISQDFNRKTTKRSFLFRKFAGWIKKGK